MTPNFRLVLILAILSVVIIVAPAFAQTASGPATTNAQGTDTPGYVIRDGQCFNTRTGNPVSMKVCQEAGK